MRHRWIVAVVIVAMLSLGGYALGHTSGRPPARAGRLPAVAVFCRSHRTGGGFWTAAGHGSFLQQAVDGARWNHRQFNAVAGTMCAMLHRLATGHTVLVPDGSASAPERRPLHRRELVRAIGELERLPDATAGR